MDPKHQFAAQYVLSRAAAERREREILASSSLGIKDTNESCDVNAAGEHARLNLSTIERNVQKKDKADVTPLRCTGAGLGVLGGSQTGGPQNLQQPPMCPSPSAHSDSSSGNGRLSSAGSEPGTLRYLFYAYYHLQTIARRRVSLDITDVMSSSPLSAIFVHLFFPDFSVINMMI